MKILHICSYYVGSWAYRGLIYGIGKTVEKNTIYVFTDDKSTYKHAVNESVIVSRCYPAVSRYLFYWKHQLVIKDLPKKTTVTDYQLVHAHSLFSNGYIAYKMFLKYGVPYIVNVSNTDLNFFFGTMPFMKSLGNKILDKAQKVVFISKPYMDKTIDIYVNNKDKILSKSSVIPYCIDDFWIKNAILKKSFKRNKELKLIFIGQIDKNKNTETTIAACKLLIQRGYKIDFLIVGGFGKNGQKDNSGFIKYVPHSNKEELLTMLRESDIFIMPSKNETFGLVYPEAMSQGIPVIYSKGEGFDDQYPDGEVGYSVDCGDPKEIADKVELILSDYERISTNCSAHIADFEMGNIARRYHQIYSAAVNES